MTIIIILLLIILLLINRQHFFSNTFTIRAKISKTPKDIIRGLMYRKNPLAKDNGMLFVMGKGIHSFWMKNTYIPLDMIFLDDKYNVVGYIKNRKPLDMIPMNIGKESYYVLEMNGGWVDRNDIKIGTNILVQI